MIEEATIPVSQTTDRSSAYDVERIRRDFPILSKEVHKNPLVYLDTAATAQKPRAVIDRLARYYEEENANVHRGIHYLSSTATRAFENARERVQRFINAEHDHEVRDVDERSLECSTLLRRDHGSLLASIDPRTETTKHFQMYT